MKHEFCGYEKERQKRTWYTSTSYSTRTRSRKNAKQRKNEQKRDKNKEKNAAKDKESKEIQEASPTNSFLVGNYGQRRAERWKDMPSISSEVDEIEVCLYTVCTL